MPGNGTIPIGSTPGADVIPTEAPFVIRLGLAEMLAEHTSSLPSELLDFPVSKSAAYAFKEYAFDDNNGTVVTVNLNGQTIDWNQSELSSSGQVSLELGILRPYILSPKTYIERKYTYVELTVVYDDNGESKFTQWIVRMKHF